MASWYREAKENVLPDCLFALIGTKSDLESEVEYDEGIKLMNDYKLDLFFETSAKSNVNVAELFEGASKEMLEKSLQVKTLKDKYDKDIRLQSAMQTPQRGGGCCG